MDRCTANRAIARQVKQFIEHVADVKEESITDYLVWQWDLLDARFSYIQATPFNHHQESTVTGADFDLELWLVGRTRHFSLAVQAKKFIRQYDGYVRKLRYPGNTKSQMDRLLTYAAANNRLAFYFIYTVPEASTASACFNKDDAGCGVFMADAYTLEDYADGLNGQRISRDRLVSESLPFHCMFCCPLVARGGFFKRYFPRLKADEGTPNDQLPGYVTQLLAGPDRRGPDAAAVPEGFRYVGVYDMRDFD